MQNRKSIEIEYMLIKTVLSFTYPNHKAVPEIFYAKSREVELLKNT